MIIEPYSIPRIDVTLELEPIKTFTQDLPKISVMANAARFCFSNVFIIKQHNQYRLIVKAIDRIVTNNDYDSVKGARIAFLKLHQLKAVKDNMTPYWTNFYHPNTEWLQTNQLPLQ